MSQTEIPQALFKQIEGIQQRIPEENLPEDVRTAFREAINKVVLELLAEFENKPKTDDGEIRIPKNLRMSDDFWKLVSRTFGNTTQTRLPDNNREDVNIIREELIMWMIKYSNEAKSK